MNISANQHASASRELLTIVANKWALLVLASLRTEPLRFNQLKRHIEGVSQKMLSETLKRLETAQLLERTVYATVPVSVEYTLTDQGVNLAQNVYQLLLALEDIAWQIISKKIHIATRFYI